MLNKIMWNIFKETGNIYAYMYVKERDVNLREFNECCYDRDKNNNVYTEETLEMNGITLMT
ncbi:MAG TPA: YqzL family protein [Oscillospiraceae bacterium]|nr:YqzL family protein [Oscillospiraceae bacterium]